MCKRLKQKHMKTTTILLTFLLLITVSAFSQNALCPATLRIFDKIVVDESLEDAYDQNFRGNYINEDLFEQSISEMVWEGLCTKDVELYKFDFNNDPFKSNEKQDLCSFFGCDDKRDLLKLDHNIRTILFFEDWSLDKENFVFTKELIGYCPVKLHQREADANGYAPIRKYALGTLRFTEETRKKYSSQKNKNLIPIKKIAYEFLMINEYWLETVAQNTSFDPYSGGPSLFYKENNAQWSEFHAQKLMNAIFDQIMNEKRAIYNLENEKPVDIFKIHEELFPEEYDYEPGSYAAELLKDSTFITDALKYNIYSIIFFEEWSLDTVSLFIQKKVTAVAPIYWKENRDRLNWDLIVDESGNPTYTKIPLFKIYFNNKD